MNRKRRDDLRQVVNSIRQIIQTTESIRMEEVEYYDNIPENLLESEYACDSEFACDQLEFAINDLDVAVDEIEEAIEGYRD